MKKYLLSSLLILMISLVWAKSHFLDMRVGDFGCITRVVFEFTGKVDYSVKEEDNKLSIMLNSLNNGKIQLPVEQSDNINNIVLTDGNTSAQVALEFIYPIEVTSYNYFQESKNYIIVFDIYDKDYHTDMQKGLATILFKAQKFPLNKSKTEIAAFSDKYSSVPLVNLYLGRLYAKKQMKTIAIEYFKKIDSKSEFFLTAQAYIDNLNKNRYPQEEVKPDFLIKVEIDNSVNESNKKDIQEYFNNEDSLQVAQNVNKIEETEEENTSKDDSNNEENSKTNNAQSTSNKFLYLYLIIALVIIVIQFVQNIKRKFIIKELSGKLESSNFELRALENKLAKGVVENSKTKEKIIIKLFNSGWKPQDIANELNTSIEVIEATISKEGRL